MNAGAETTKTVIDPHDAVTALLETYVVRNTHGETRGVIAGALAEFPRARRMNDVWPAREAGAGESSESVAVQQRNMSQFRTRGRRKLHSAFDARTTFIFSLLTSV